MNRVQARSHAMKRSRRPQRDPIFCQIPMSRTRTLKVPAFSWAAFSGDLLLGALHRTLFFFLSYFRLVIIFPSLAGDGLLGSNSKSGDGMA